MDPGITAALAMGGAHYAAPLLGIDAARARLLAIVAIVLLALLTARGTRLATGFLVVVTAVKVAALLAIVVWGFASGAADGSRFGPWFERAAGAEPLVAGLAGGFVSAFFSFGGWWEASKMAGEVRNPSATLPIAFVGGVAIVTALYVLASTVFFAVLPFSDLLSPESAAALLGERLFGPVGGRVLAAVVLLSATGSLAALVLTSPRLYVAMARDGVFPHRLAEPHRRWGTPVGAIAVQAVLACLLVALGTFADVVAFFVFTSVAFITLSVASIYVLPATEGGVPRRRIAAGFFVAISAVLLVLVASGRPLASLAGTAIVLLGIPVHALRKRSVARRTA
jgi:APA family basic amino acid/polyamine antiporter